MWTDYEQIRSDMNKEHDETKRIEGQLLYKSKHEYEEMIRRLENDMRFNIKQFRPHDESRILNDIATHKRGLTLIDDYDKKKLKYEELRHSFYEKKREYENFNTKIIESKKNLASRHEELKRICQNIDTLKEEIKQLHDSKLKLKKELEDLNKENLIKHLNVKKANQEKKQAEKQKKKDDDVLIKMEETAREYNKLITYFQKLSLNSPSESFDSSGSDQQLSQTRQVSTTHAPTTLTYATSLPHFKITQRPELSKASSLNTKQTSCINSLKLQPPNSLGISFEINEQESNDYAFKSPIDEHGGQFIMKKRLDDTAAMLSNKSLSSRTARKQKATKKVSHSVEIINSMTSMNIPIDMLSQYDECLKLLNEKRDFLQAEIDAYKLAAAAAAASVETNTCAKTSMTSATTTGNETETSSVSNHSIMSAPCTSGRELAEQPTKSSDAISEISSCLDSNYDSDTSNNIQESKLQEPCVVLAKQVNNLEDLSINKLDSLALVATELPNGSVITVPLNQAAMSDGGSTTSRPTSPNTPTNSVSVIGLNEPVVVTVMKKEETINTNLPTPTTITLPTASTTTPSIERSLENKLDQPISAPVVGDNTTLVLLRQTSDGYGSSASPLSAGSISNEQASVNPFFLPSSSSSSSS